MIALAGGPGVRNPGEVIGGGGAFALQCLDGAGLADAMRRIMCARHA